MVKPRVTGTNYRPEAYLIMLVVWRLLKIFSQSGSGGRLQGEKNAYVSLFVQA